MLDCPLSLLNERDKKFDKLAGKGRQNYGTLLSSYPPNSDNAPHQTYQ